jgi:primosomal protein N' (replication factor Y)
MKIKDISRVISEKPVMTHAMLQTMLWMCEYYLVSPRRALQVFLPGTPWRNIVEEPQWFYSMGSAPHDGLRGKNQIAAIEYVKKHTRVRDDELLHETGASGKTLSSLVDKEVLRVEQAKPVTNLRHPNLSVKTNESDEKLSTTIFGDARPTLVLDESATNRTQLFLPLIAKAWNAGKSSIVIAPNISQADAYAKELQSLLGSQTTVHTLHSSTTVATRRELYRTLPTAGQSVVVGTRTALFAPIHDIGLLIVDDEHEWTLKSEQTPRYHARLTAEVLSRQAHAKLVMISGTPSLESLKHTKEPGGRYTLSVRNDGSDAAAAIEIVDLTLAEFGKVYPFTAPLLQALKSNLEKKEVSVLVLNRRGTATSMLCFDCKQPIVSKMTNLPYSVVTVQGKPMLFDRAGGERIPVPEQCPNCKSFRLKPVGAGTEGAEQLLHKIFPAARIARIDAETLDEPKAVEKILKRIDGGEIDIAVGTQPVVRALASPRVTFAGVLIADIGLSRPDFRAGERVFQLLATIALRMRRKGGKTVVQTFRPETPEIKHAIDGKPLEYLESELTLREKAKYPPSVQMIALIVRGDRKKAIDTYASAQKAAHNTSVSVSMMEEMHGGRGEWQITLRGEKLREVLAKIPLAGVVVDVDPIE